MLIKALLMLQHNSIIKKNSQYLLAKILDQLQATASTFAIIHMSSGTDFDTSSDIDIAFDKDPRKVLEPILARLHEEGVVRIVQRLHYEVPYGFYYVLSPIDAPRDYLHLDCLYDPYGINRYHLSTGFLLQDIDMSCGFPRVNAERSAIYLLIKRSIKNSATHLQLECICRTLSASGPVTRKYLQEWVGEENAEKILKHSSLQRDVSITQVLVPIRNTIESKFMLYHPVRYLLGTLWTIYRKIGRLLVPTGLFVVLIGPDGAGKSTVNNVVLEQLARAFRRTHHFHWRPGFLPKLGRKRNNAATESVDNDKPASTSRYGTAISLIRFAYYWVDFILGYWAHLYPVKAQTTLIVGERYFPDIIVHPARYGFALPQWLMRGASLLVPNPDLTVLLSNTPEAIHARKAELPIEVIKYQLEQYSNELQGWGYCINVQTDASPEEVSTTISEKIIELCDRTNSRKLFDGK